jgi:RES domain-containing protein
MMPLPPPLGGGELVFWRLDQARFAGSWDSGEGAWLAGGRWNSRGRRAVYAALDPATAILEVAVHKTVTALDRVAHVLTRARLTDPAQVHVVTPAQLPEADWLRPGLVVPAQQAYGDGLLSRHPVVLIPSVVSAHSWNVLFDPQRAAGLYGEPVQEPFVLDPRLHAPAPH